MYTMLKNRFASEVFQKEKTMRVAFEKAYADMSRRATGHKPQMKDACIEWLVNSKVFEAALDCRNQDSFDEWHRNTCLAIKNIHGSFGRIGRSQKVINMAFKYLSCIDHTYDDILQYCHMTLDGYTLNWYRSIGGRSPEWSKIDDYDEYLTIQKRIRNHLSLDPAQASRTYSIRTNHVSSKSISLSPIPFEAEFVVWEGEIINEKYNELTKSLNRYKAKDKQKDNWLIEDSFDSFLKDLCQTL